MEGLGVPLGSTGVLGRAFEGLGRSSGGPWVLSGVSFGLLGRSLGVLGVSGSSLKFLAGS